MEIDATFKCLGIAFVKDIMPAGIIKAMQTSQFASVAQ